nr:MAG: replication initiator protein [Microviridae sp.]
MACYHPITAYRSRQGRNQSGSWPLVFKRSEGYDDKKVVLPCGKCIGCKLEYSRQWAVRAWHESKMHQNNSFICLTYDDDKVQNDVYSLVPEDLQKFWKRLRKKHKFQYLACGEYGEEKMRPHYHACLFGLDFQDRDYLSKSQSGENYYHSEELYKTWGLGRVSVQDFSWETAAYVGRYMTKKITGDKELIKDGIKYLNADHYYNGRIPEFLRSSRRPSIGQKFYDKYKTELYGYDECVIRNGIKTKVPRYYDKKYKDETTPLLPGNVNDLKLRDLSTFDLLKHKRGAQTNLAEQEPERLLVKEKIHLQKATKLRRNYETDLLCKR